MNWKVKQNQSWPFTIHIVDNEDKNILSLEMPAYCTSQNNIADVMSARGFKGDEKELAQNLNKQQVERAQLFSAAPDMLEALEFVVKRFAGDDLLFSQRLAISKAKDAIAKAKGE